MLMTKGLGKANDREVFVSHEGMDVQSYKVKELQVGGCVSSLNEVHLSLQVIKETYTRFFDFSVHDLFDVHGYGVMVLRGYGVKAYMF